MRTILDEYYTSFLRHAQYADGVLRVLVAEGFCASEPQDLVLGGHVIKDTFAIFECNESRLIEVQFQQPIAWQLVDESFTAGNDYELREGDGALQVLTQSQYLDYVCANHGWFEDMCGPGKHYRIWTENEVVDVIACETPTLSFCRRDQQSKPDAGAEAT